MPDRTPACYLDSVRPHAIAEPGARAGRRVRAPAIRCFMTWTSAWALALAGLAGCAGLPGSRSSNSSAAPAAALTSVFPLAAYAQNVDTWISPASPGYDRPFLSAADQRAHFTALLARYFGLGADDPSPWNPAFVATRVYRYRGHDIAALQQRRLERYDNTAQSPRHLGYGQNLRPHTAAWLAAIARNIDNAQFERPTGFDASRRAIATANLLVRGLPTMDPSFYSDRIAGQGYPFDNLQISAIKPGTPLYILGTSLDGAWRYVQTPDVQGWVRSTGLGLVDDAFANAWRAAAAQGLGGVIGASVAVRDSGGTFRFDAPAGTLLPLLPPAGPDADNVPPASPPAKPEARTFLLAPPSAEAGADTYSVLVPVRDADGHAILRYARLSEAQLAPLPLSATPRHLAMLLKALIGRPYGWGNTGFYNDCSSELQSIFASFGVWLPRHSSNQMNAGAMLDLSADTPAQRIAYLVRHGAPFRTIIYIGGHVMLYLGNTVRGNQVVPLIYQDVWGLRPADNSRRAVIGGSVIMPLLAHIPEDPALESLAATPIFQVTVLGALPGHAPLQTNEDDPAS